MGLCGCCSGVNLPHAFTHLLFRSHTRHLQHHVPPALGSGSYIKATPFLQVEEQEEEEEEDRLLFEMELWRADMLSSVVEVDANGNMVPPDASEPINPMCPAGLATGAGLSSLKGHISRLLPAFKGRSSIAELMSAFGDPNANPIKASMRGGRQGAKVQQISGVQAVKVLHQGDSALVNLTAQIVLKKGINNRAFVVMSVDQPQCGRPDFCVWLKMPFVQAIYVKPAAAVISPPGSDGSISPQRSMSLDGDLAVADSPKPLANSKLIGMDMPRVTKDVEPTDMLGLLQRDLLGFNEEEASAPVGKSPLGKAVERVVRRAKG